MEGELEGKWKRNGREIEETCLSTAYVSFFRKHEREEMKWARKIPVQLEGKPPGEKKSVDMAIAEDNLESEKDENVRKWKKCIEEQETCASFEATNECKNKWSNGSGSTTPYVALRLSWKENTEEERDDVQRKTKTTKSAEESIGRVREVLRVLLALEGDPPKLTGVHVALRGETALDSLTDHSWSVAPQNKAQNYRTTIGTLAAASEFLRIRGWNLRRTRTVRVSAPVPNAWQNRGDHLSGNFRRYPCIHVRSSSST